LGLVPIKRDAKNLPKREKSARPMLAKIALGLIPQTIETKYHMTNQKSYQQFENFVDLVYASCTEISSVAAGGD
jgi:hypothetical protein